MLLMMMLCRICLKRSRDLLNLFDFMDAEHYPSDKTQEFNSSASFLATKMVSIIEQHFWFKLQPNDKISRCICKRCWRRIDKFHDFYESIRRAQDNFKLSSKDDAMDEREEFMEELEDDEDEENNIIKKEPSDSESYETDESDVNDVTPDETLNSLVNVKFNVHEVALVDVTQVEEDDRDGKPGYASQAKEGAEFEINFPQNPLIEHEIDLSLCKAEILRERSLLDGMESDNNDEENVLLKDLLSSKRNTKRSKLRQQKTTESFKAQQKGLCRRMTRLRNKPLKRKRSMEQKESALSMESQNSASSSLLLNAERRRKKPRVKHDPQLIGNLIKKHIQMACSLCTFVGEIFTDIIQHFSEQHPTDKPYIMCCKRKLNKPYLITQHALKHENPDYFRCHECEKSFVDDSGLRAHNMYHHAAEEEKIHACEFCSQRFARKLLLELHKGTHIPQEERSIVCHQCPTKKTFATEYLLQIHNSMRHKREANVCHICAKKIRDKRCFEKHVRQHSESNSLRTKCTYPGCDSWLKDEDTLKQHMRRHNPNQKSYDCPDCGKFCKNRRALTNHKRSSHSTQTYNCDECGKTFKKALSLKEHMARHTGEALYKCPFCTRTFNSNANMHSHKKKMHPLEWEEWRKYQRGSAQILNCNPNSGSSCGGSVHLMPMQTFYGNKMTNLPITTMVQEQLLHEGEK